MAKSGNQRSLDVTSGVIWKQLLKLSLPVFFSSFFQQTYALVNAWVVGRFAGKQALAAIQATTSLNDLVVGFSVGMGVGFGVIVSQYFGAHQNEKLSHAMHTAMGLALIGGLAFSCLGVSLSGWLLQLMHTPADIIDESLKFVRVYMSALVFSITFNTGSALQRAVGDTRTPSIIVAITSVVNIVLDFVFVAAMQLGAMGCGLSTACSLAVGSLVTLYHLCHVHEAWGLRISKLRIEPHVAWLMIKTGLPLGIQSSVYSISNIIAQSAFNSFGSDTVAAWGLSGRIDAVIWIVSEALGSSVTTFAAQNFGACNYDRMKAGLKTSLLITIAVIGSLSTVVVLASYPLALLFVPDTTVANLTSVCLTFIGPFYVFFSIMDNFSGTIRGAGESLRPMLLTILGTCIFRVLWLLLFVPTHHTLQMVLVSYPVTWILTAALFVVYFRHGHWLQHAAVKERERLNT